MGCCFSSTSGNHLPRSASAQAANKTKNKCSKSRCNGDRKKTKRQGLLLQSAAAAAAAASSSSSSSSSLNSRGEDMLWNIPGRIYLNGSSATASLFTQQGRKGTNQDAMLAWENFGSRPDTVFCGVFDGHGPFGHQVARRVRDSLPLQLTAHLGVSVVNLVDLRRNSVSGGGSMNSEETANICFEEEPRGSLDSIEERDKYPEIFTTLKEAFLKAFRVMDKELRLQHSINCFCSGTTAVTLIKQGQDLVVGNVGDSRAVLCTRDEDDHLNAIQLTVDLKPNLPKEEERIKRCKGRVFALQDEPDVARVWLPNNNSPGLAMARAFGDFCLKEFGLISVPEISYRQLTERDDFIVLASDGVWDVLSNTEVVEIVASAPHRPSAARFLVESAVRAWRYKYPTSKVDDCAVVCLFLNADLSNNAASSYSDAKELSETSSALENVDVEDQEVSSAPSFLLRAATVRTTSDQILLGEAEGSPKSGAGERSPGGNKTTTTDAVGSLASEDGVSRVDTVLTLARFDGVGGDECRADSKLHK